VTNGGTAPTSVVKGSTFSVTTGTIQNVGNAASGNYTVTFYASTSTSNIASGINLGSVSMTSLAAGASTTATLNNISTASLNANTSYYIGWVVSNVANETVTNNNTAYRTTAMSVTPAPTTAPDIVASNGGTVPTSVVKGSTFNVTTGTVRNDGTLASGTFTLTFYASTSTSTLFTSGINLGSYSTTSGLAVGASTTYAASNISTANLTAGTSYYIGWVISNVTGETVTTNNSAYCTTLMRVDAPAPEPGDTIATAENVTFTGTPGTYSSGTQRIGDGPYGDKDVDIFKFTVSAADVGKTFTFRTASVSGQSTVDTYIRLFNASGVQLAYDDDGGDGFYSYLTWTPTAAGTYYLGVSSWSNSSYNPTIAGSGPGGSTGYYTLTINIIPNVQPLPRPVSISATSKNATTLTVSWNTIANASGYTIQYATDSNFTQNVKTQAVSGGNTSSADITGLTSNTMYYIRVLAVGTGNYSNSPYSTSVSAMPLSDPGETIATALSVTFTGTPGTYSSGVQQIGDGLYGVKDVDMYKFTVSAADVGKIFTFTTARPAGLSWVDTYIRLFNASGTQLAYDDDSGDDYCYSSLTWAPTAAGTYYLGVSSFANSSYNPTVAGSGPGMGGWDLTPSTGYYTLTITAPGTRQLDRPTGIDATAKNSTTVTVKWNAVANASSYVIQYATDSGFTQNVRTQNVSGGTASSADVTGLTANTTYYFRVMAVGTGSYTSSTYSGWFSVKTPVPPAEPGDTIATAFTVAFAGSPPTFSSGVQQIGDGSYGTRDVDMFQFTVTAGQVGKAFTFRTAQPSGYSSVDTYIRLFNASGTQLAYDDDGGDGLYSYLSWTPTAEGTYYLGVSSYGNRTYTPTSAGSGPGGTTGYYTLTIMAPIGSAQLDRPTGITATAKSSSTVTVKWNAVANASSYVIQYATDSGFTQNVKTQSVSGGSTNSADVTGLTANTTYYFRVMAVGTGSYTSSTYSGWYDAKTLPSTLIPLDRPTGITATAKNTTTITVKWNAVSNASSYVIQYATDSGFTQNVKTQAVAGGSANSADVTGLSSSTTYYFRVMAVGTGSYSSSTYSGWYSAKPEVPASAPDLSASNGGTAPASIVRGNTFSVTTGTIQNVGNAASGSYKVTFYASTSTSNIASGINLGSVTMPSLAAGASTTATLSGISSASLSGSSYYIGWVISSVSGETVTGNNTAYRPTVMAVTTGATGQLERPAGITAVAKNSSTVTMNWAAVANASSYTIQYATDSAFTQNVKTQNVSGGSTSSADVTGLSANTTYYFRVMAVGTGSYTSSAYSGWYSVKTPVGTSTTLDRPTGILATAKNSSTVTVNWNAVSNASSYVIQYATNKDFTQNVKTQAVAGGTSNTADVTGLTANTTYYFRVMAVGTGSYVSSTYSGWYDAKTPVATSTTLERPTGIAAVPKNATTMTVVWSPVSNASSYVIQYATDSGFTQNVKTQNVSGGTSNAADVTGLTANTMYYFRVMAVGTGSYISSTYSGWYNAKTPVATSTTLDRPTGIEANPKSATTVTVKWNAVSNASSYVIQYATDSGFTQNVKTQAVSGGTSSSADVTGLTANTTYYFRVMAVGTGSYVSSTYSGWYSVKTPVATSTTLDRPTGIAANPKSATTVTVSWNVVSNASSYVIQYATDSGFTQNVKTQAVSSGAANWADVTGLTANTTYYFRVMAVGTGSYISSTYSGWYSVKTPVAASIPLDRPTGIAVVTKNATTLTVVWNPVSNASGYVIQYATDSGFTQNVKTQNVSSGSANLADVTGLSANTTYYFRVLAVGTGSYVSSTYSGWYSAKTP